MAWLYIGLLVFYVMVMFVFVRRPMYEAVATAFLSAECGKYVSVVQHRRIHHLLSGI